MCDRCSINAIVGAIFGIIVGILFFLGLITGIVTALWIALGFAGIALILLSIISSFAKKDVDKCICARGNCLLIAVLGTIVTVIIALATTITVGGIGSAILIGIVAAFFGATVLAFYDLFKCIIKYACRCKEKE